MGDNAVKSRTVVDREALLGMAAQLHSAVDRIHSVLASLAPLQIEIARATGSSEAAAAYADFWGRHANLLAGLASGLGAGGAAVQVAADAYTEADRALDHPS